MKAITLRNLPREVTKAIQEKAREKKISVNKAVIELLEERLGVLRRRDKMIHQDLDTLAGSWSTREAKAFERAVEVGRQIDEDLWG
jgi:DNA polymerase III delta subunit